MIDVVAGADISFRHGAVVVMDRDGPADCAVVRWSRRRRGESWADYVARGRRAHQEQIDDMLSRWAHVPLTVELWPERVPHSQHQAPAVAAAAWWAGAWPGSRYVEIREWRRAIWPRSVTTAHRGDRKGLAISTALALGWEVLLRQGTTVDLRGDLAEAALIAYAVLQGGVRCW